MILLAFAAAVAATNFAPALAEANHALVAGRLDQAQIMIARAVAAGANGDPVDRLLAQLAFARGQDEQALALNRGLLMNHPATPLFAEQAGISALRLGRVAEATALLRAATALPGASWRAWNALGAAADDRSDWPLADTAYAHAQRLSPDRAEIANNRGWSLLLRGRWREAEAELARGLVRGGSASAASAKRMTNNLQLARAALATALPLRSANESDEAWAARLNDAGVAAAMTGDRARAIAAFTGAIGARPRWDGRAAANLAAIEGQR